MSVSKIDPGEIIVPFNNEIDKLWAESDHWKRPCSNSEGDITNKYTQRKRIKLIKRTR